MTKVNDLHIHYNIFPYDKFWPPESNELEKFFVYKKMSSGAYFDAGSFKAWDLTDPKKLDVYLDTLFEEFNQAGIDQIYISFAQIEDIDLLIAYGERSVVDAIADWLNEYPGLLDKFVNLAHQNNIKVSVSFGGQYAQGMKISKAGESPKDQANKLLSFVSDHKIDNLDFDLEEGGAIEFSKVNTPIEAKDFFYVLKKELNNLGKSLTLTVEGSTSKWPENYLRELFYDDSNRPIFSSLFDGLNLMLYGKKFYLDTVGDWGVETWLDIIGKKNAPYLHIGFQDSINYADLSNWQPSPEVKKCPWTVRPGSSSGSAAAQIFKELQQKLKEDGYTSELGSPFWWPARNGGGVPDRYAPTNSGQAQFGLEVEKDFYQELNIS